MENLMPTCSNNSITEQIGNNQENINNSNNEDLSEIQELQNLNVWGEHQEVLEEQALKELEIFAKENRKVDEELEEGEVSDDNNKESSVIVQSTGSVTLDLNSYIKRQEELKKRQEHKRSLEISNHSKVIANNFSKKHNQNITLKILKRKAQDDANACSAKVKRNKNDVKTNHDESHVEEDASGSEYVPSDEYNSDNEAFRSESKRKQTDSIKTHNIQRVKDDGCLKTYKSRLGEYYKHLESQQSEDLNNDDDDEEIELQGGLKVPGKMWNNLYGYQQEGIRWLWKIHQDTSGGLLGDEMGLGKTVQVIVFLAALSRSRLISRHGRYTGLGPTVIVSPATVIHQWVKHFHDWAPEFRVAVLHQSGSYAGNKTQLIRDINQCKGILITTYSAILKYKGSLTELNWHYVILDEGHKIRNSGAKVSIAVKQLQTPHRIMLTGSPMQNNLQELWSLFDFVVPGMLGTLPTFLEHFANPIMHGGYANATPMQEATALSVATALKDIISPYLLRRSKNDVRKHISLPNKSEQVLFCSLTDEQRDLYKGFLMSEHVSMILGRGGKNWFSENRARANVLVAITTLRKICNHPDLYLGEAENDYFNSNTEETPIEDKYGYYKRSGKMVVVSALLKIWKKQKHRVLLFTQARAMVGVFEEFLTQQDYRFLKMDGSTSISSRQPLIDKFNQDSSFDVFLLTTRVGGLGVNLTGANRVIIYDPDWNPATDTQARERAWRIGQEKQVTVYRLISAGTIEEKMYQRQVWKQLLSNKVLLDPRTQRFFKTSDLHDLFSLQEQVSGSNPETANIFRNSRVNLQEKINKQQTKNVETATSTSSTESFHFTDEKIQAMKDLAQQIAKSISSKPADDSNFIEQSKSGIQKELEQERAEKLKEKEHLKTLTPMELRVLNRKKLEKDKQHSLNTIDDCNTNVSFENALNISEKTAKLYNDVKSNKIKINEDNCSVISDNYKPHCSSGITNEGKAKKSKSKHKKKKNKEKTRKKTNNVKIDLSGTVDGEVVEGLLKKEIKEKEKKSKNENNANEKQDQYVLEKLFSKKGVQTALQHDVIVQSGYKDKNNIKIHWEAQQRTDVALQALRKSRLDNWRW